MATEFIAGTDGDDVLTGGTDSKDFTGGLGNDVLDATQGENTIHFNPGDGIDTVNFNVDRDYQYADFLHASTDALSDPANFSNPEYRSSFFRRADRELINTLPSDIASVLGELQDNGSVDPTAAFTALSSLVDWINTPTSNVIDFGPGISLSDITVQLGGGTTSFGSPTEFSVSVKGQEGMLFEYAGFDSAANRSGGPVALPISFRFDDGTTVSYDSLLATNHSGSIGTQFGDESDEQLIGSLSGDSIFGQDGDDRISGGAGIDMLNGDAGNDAIDGGAGSDYVNGGDGDDVLGVGRDGGIASGGAGDDVYLFNTGDGVMSIDNQGASGDVDTISFGRIDPASVTASLNATSGVLTLQIQGSSDQVSMQWFDPANGSAENPSQVVSKVQFIDDQGQARIFDLAGIVRDLFSDPTQWQFDVPLFEDAAHELTGTQPLAGGELAVRYAVGGDMFAHTNLAPISSQIAEQAVQEDAGFSFTIPANAFADPEGQALSFAAVAADGQALPSWLQFDAATGTFSGTPSNGDVGTLAVQVTATDPAGLSVAQTFDLVIANTNDAPVVAYAIADQAASEDGMFTFVLPANTFADIDAGDSLTLNATLADGSALPSWLSFDPNTRTLSGMPANGDVGTLHISVTATDGSNTSVSSVFHLDVANTNDAPTVEHGVPDQTTTAGSAFSLVLPANTFADIDAGDALTYSAHMQNGDALPSWLQFDATTRTLSGTAGSAGNWDIQITATDLSGASVSDVFALNVQPTSTRDQTITGGNGNDVLNGGNGNDTITGAKGIDSLFGGNGNDTLNFSRDASWKRTTRTNAGSPGELGSNDTVSLNGMGRSYDMFDGGDGYDKLVGTSGKDAILLDDSSIPASSTGPRISNIERIEAGAGNDLVDLTSQRYAYGDVTIDGGSGNDVLWSSSGNDVLLGGSGNDKMHGGAGNDYLVGGTGNDTLNGGEGVDLLQGGAGSDKLTDTAGNSLMDGGAGNDSLTSGGGDALMIGGRGNDKLVLGGGYDVIAFNRGDGRDTVNGENSNATLSLGGGIRYQDLTLRRSGSSLILQDGAGDRIKFDKWYDGKRYQSVSTLQIITGSPSTAQSGDPLANDKVETFDFTGVVAAFDAATSNNHGVSKWALTNALAQFQLGGSNTAALGGDMAYQYGVNGTLAGVAMSAAQEVTNSAQFGKAAQTLNPQTQPQDPTAVTLS